MTALAPSTDHRARTAGRDAAPAGIDTRTEMDARIARHAIAPGRVAVLDLVQNQGGSELTGTDRAVALGAVLTGVAAAIGLAVGLA